MPTPNRAQRDAATWARLYLALGRDTAAAAGLSALIRAARTKSSAAYIRALAADWCVTDHPEFIV